MTMVIGIGGQPTAALAIPPVTAVPLGLASSFAVLTPAAVGNTATGAVTTLRGDLGAGGGATGFPPGVYTGTLFTGAATNPALADLTTAYADATGRPAGLPLAADLIGVTVGPGVHTNAAAVANTGTFTIDAGGDPNAVFIFQIGGALAMAAASHVVLTGQAQAANIFWAVNGAGAVGAGATFAGTLMATAAIAVGDGTVFNGRALSKAGAITMTSAQFYSVPPTVSIDPGPSAYTTDTSPTLTGTTSLRSPATVTVTVNGETLQPVPDINGAWSATPAALLANGTYPVVATVIDGAGNTGSFSQQLTVDTLPPIVTIAGGTSITTNSLTPTFHGTTDIAPNQVVTFTVTRLAPATTTILTTTAQSDGTWNISPSGFADGQWTVTAQVTDPAGNSTSAFQNVTVNTSGPSAAITSPTLSNDSSPTISGTVDLLASVTVSIDGALSTVAVVNGMNWSAAYTGTSLLDGPHNVAVAATVAGNVTTISHVLTIDTVAPVITIAPGAANTTNDLTPTVSGVTNAIPGALVTVTVSTAPTMLALVQSDGSWNVTPSSQLSAGTVTVTASVLDLAGNTGSYSQSLTIDVTPPLVSIDGGASRATANMTPTISGTVSGASIGAPVQVTVAGQALSTTVTALLTWSVTAETITNGTHVAFVNVVDIAGNVGYASQSLTVNAVTPIVSIDGGPATATNDATPTISGVSNAATGSDVVVGVGGQTLHATVQPGGSWNVTASLISNSIVTVVARVTDPDGNVGSATQSLTINTAGVATISITGGPAHTTNDPTPNIAGTTDASNGRVLAITVDNQTMWAVIVGGNWSVTAAHLDDGTYPVIVVLSSIGGSPAAASQVLTVDTVVDTVPPGGHAGDDFVPVGPKRVFDTRPGMSPNAMRQVTKATIGGQVELRVRLTDLPGLVPAAGVSAVSLNVTATDSTVAGYITVYACGTREVVSSLNFDAGATVANAVITPLSTSGDVCFYSNTTTNVIVDVNGWFATGAAFNAIGPKRVFDTRTDAGSDVLRNVSKTKVAADGVLEVQVTDLAGFVPPTGVSAVSLNVVVTNPDLAGYLTVYSCGSRALVSSVNYVAGATVANAVIAPVSPSGTVCFYSLAGVDLVVDINGWLATGTGFRPAGPARVADTRPGQSPNALRAVAKSPIGGTTILELQVTDIPGFVPASGVSTVSLNVTAVNPTGAGYINVYSCGALEEVSSLNFVAGQTVANAVLAPVSPSGTICLYANLATDVVVDINGWIGHTQAS